MVAGAENCHELLGTWNTLHLTKEEQCKWNLIADPQSVPMRIELVRNTELAQYSEEILVPIWIKYGNFPNRDTFGKSIISLTAKNPRFGKPNYV